MNQEQRMRDAAKKKYGCPWSELHGTTREDFETGWQAAQSVHGEPVAWGVPNSRPTEKHPLMMVMLDKTSAQYQELLIPLYTASPNHAALLQAAQQALDLLEPPAGKFFGGFGPASKILRDAIEKASQR